jgi:hypothetical protein
MTGLSSVPTALALGACWNDVCEATAVSVDELADPLPEPGSPPDEPDVDAIKVDGTHGR